MLLALALLFCAWASPARAAVGNLSAAVANDGASVLAETPVDASMVDLTVASPALHASAMVRLVLPHDFYSQPAATWPALYMLEGAGSAADYASWTTYSNYESFIAGKDVLSVLPSDGQAGFYSSEYDNGTYAGPDYQTFIAVELPQILARGYRASGRNAIAGLSIGGMGAFDFAADYPGQYSAAASYSGPLNTQTTLAEGVIDAGRLRDGFGINSLWGDPTAQAAVWAAHNPTALVAKLRGVPLFISSGNGLPGPFDTTATTAPPTTLSGAGATAEAGFLESASLLSNQQFACAAIAAGDNLTADFYGNGTHTWPYWQREFQRSWPLLAGGLGVPVS